jgi:hypothetical protein
MDREANRATVASLRGTDLDPHEWITQREAAEILHEDIGVHRESARRMLAAGLVGRGRSTSRATYYLRRVVDDFVAAYRTAGPLPQRDRNLVLVRVGPGRVRLHMQPEDLLDRLGDGWRMSFRWRLLLDAVMERGERPGFLVTVGGFVVLGADIVGVSWAGRPPADGGYAGKEESLKTRFELEGPGEWYAEWHARHVPTGRGGAALRVWPVDRRRRPSMGP